MSGCRVEEIEWIIRTDRDVTPAQIAARLGVTIGAVRTALNRAGRTDLKAALALADPSKQGYNCGSSSCRRCAPGRSHHKKTAA